MKATAFLVGVFVAVFVAAIAVIADPDLDHPPHVERREAAPVEEVNDGRGEPPGSRLEGLQLVSDRITQYVAAETLRAAVYAAQVEAVRVPPPSVETAPAVAEAPDGGDSSGDWSATMACIRAHESDTAGGYSAENPTSTASGAYQALDSTWDGYAGYPRAVDAPPHIQDQWAIEALNAAGTQPWAGSGC